MRNYLVAVCVLAGLFSPQASLTAFSEELLNQGPGSVFVPPSEGLADEEGEPDELTTDLEFFLKAGYKSPDYEAYFNLRQEVAQNIIVPDYVKRTGKIPPEDALIDIASIYVTGGDFNDLLVFSHLPGDCNENGCLAQLYRTVDGLKWDKAIEFTSLAFAYKSPDKEARGEIVAVGNADIPSVFYVWNGKGFDVRK